jgi:hypothetical protein
MNWLCPHLFIFDLSRCVVARAGAIDHRLTGKGGEFREICRIICHTSATFLPVDKRVYTVKSLNQQLDLRAMRASGGGHGRRFGAKPTFIRPKHRWIQARARCRKMSRPFARLMNINLRIDGGSRPDYCARRARSGESSPSELRRPAGRARVNRRGQSVGFGRC